MRFPLRAGPAAEPGRALGALSHRGRPGSASLQPQWLAVRYTWRMEPPDSKKKHSSVFCRPASRALRFVLYIAATSVKSLMRVLRLDDKHAPSTSKLISAESLLRKTACQKWRKVRKIAGRNGRHRPHSLVLLLRLGTWGTTLQLWVLSNRVLRMFEQETEPFRKKRWP